jgi:NAD(P)-dependent dehydrogenase (short-subunit alcohol dehydrogenase family)
MSYSRLALNDKVAVIVGGTSGIGLAIARGMAEAGADVVPTSRRMDLVEAAASEIEGRGRRSIRVSSDVSDRASLQNVLDESIRAFGKVDILVNSAGRTKRAPTLDFSEEDWDDILDTNLTGTLRASQVFGRHMLGQHHQYRISVDFRGAVRSRGIFGEQSGCRFADEVAGD